MKKLVLIISVALHMSGYCLAQNSMQLRKELDILKPFVGKTWISETTDPSGQNVLHLLCKYEPMHDGKILKYYQECKELNSQTDGYFYYDSDKKDIAYLLLTNNGNITVGNVKEEDGKILKYGNVIFPDRKLEFRNTNEIKADGSVEDKYSRFEDGEWKAGHSRVWTVK